MPEKAKKNHIRKAEKMDKTYLLLDAMGIQRYVFETNTLRIIIGSSLALSQWQDTCKSLCAPSGGKLISSAGGNVLVQFEDIESTINFKDLAIKNAPPEIEIAWARVNVDPVQDAGETWRILQREIACYKAGDRGPADYPPATGRLKTPGCLHCGIRPSDGQEKLEERVSCAVCRTHWEKGRELKSNHAGNTPIEKLYAKAKSLGFNLPFPDNLEELVKNGKNKDLMAVVIIDLNDLGNRVREMISKEGFEEFEKFSAQLESDLTGIFIDFLQEIQTSPCWISANRSFLRLRPLLLGGDDIALAMPAPLWPDFVAEILNKLKSLGHPACAGVAVAKHTFPINRLTIMAEELVANAKGLVRFKKSQEPDFDGCAVDWHVHQESAFGSPNEARKRSYVTKYEENNYYEIASRRPYTLSEFHELYHQASLLEEYSNRKLYTLYQALRTGRKATRDTLVYTFLRNENRTFTKYGLIWEWLERSDGEWPLWEKKSFEREESKPDLHNTQFADLLELKFLLQPMEEGVNDD